MTMPVRASLNRTTESSTGMMLPSQRNSSVSRRKDGADPLETMCHSGRSRETGVRTRPGPPPAMAVTMPLAKTMMPPALTHSDATGTASNSINASAPVKSVKVHPPGDRQAFQEGRW